MVRATQFNSCCAELSTSFLLSYSPNRPELSSVDYKIYGVYSSVNMSCKSTKLKKSSSDWLNSGKTLIQHSSENMRFSVFLCSPGSAKALVRWGGKIKCYLTTYLLINISAKKLSKSVHVRRSYSKPKQCRFLRHSVVPVNVNIHTENYSN